MALLKTKGMGGPLVFLHVTQYFKHEESRLMAAEFLHVREIRMIM
ncbi:hypothetical protein BATR1942_10475 [Bacillus atrophaeus 1942]|jgi:hypothetical protein|uniref:Uncharacterized protein n=1 Tax=Bacillus atrophaeus (strain 1942) TaxID=720555 RepID=A0ABM5LYM3_BACA1|nr:hypothetical protein BATR1942_10475 [Bacillus atrophaeus 1942]AKL85117.1 hypothetical protein D068_cds24860 [Bacillus atrophaeus UCMB-5137]EIM12186.1 hypothetical protein UY9_02871 [Bacillus atrophaeus C89]